MEGPASLSDRPAHQPDIDGVTLMIRQRAQAHVVGVAEDKDGQGEAAVV